MKSITLHCAALTNDGTRVDAGGVVKVGTGDKAITRDRADTLVADGLAATGGSPDADSAPEPDPAPADPLPEDVVAE